VLQDKRSLQQSIETVRLEAIHTTAKAAEQQSQILRLAELERRALTAHSEAMQSKLGAMLAQKEQELESLTATYSTTTAARDALITRLETLAASHAQMAQHESQARLAAESAAAKSEGERRVLEESYNALRSQLERDRAALREEAAAVKASVAEYRVAAEQEIGDIRSRAAREQAALVQEAEAHRARMEVAMQAASRAKESLATEHAATEARLQAHVRGQLADLEALAERHRVGLLTTLSAVEAERGLAAQAAQKREAELVSAAQAAQAALARQAEMHRQQMEAAVAAASEARSAAADAAAEREARLAAESSKLHASLMGQADAHRGHMERALQAAREEQALAEARAAAVQADLQKRLEHAFEMQEAAAKEIVSAAEGYRLAAAMKHRLTDFERRLIAEQRRAATLERELESMLYGEGAAAAAEGRYLEAEHRHLLQLENGGQAPPAPSPPGRSRAASASANESGRPRSARATPAAGADATDYAAPLQSPVSPQRLQAVKGLARAASGSNGFARAASPSRLDAAGLRPVPEDRSLGSAQGPEAHRELLSPPRGRAAAAAGGREPHPAPAASLASSSRSSRYGVMRPYESGLFDHVPNTPDLVADLSAPVAQALGLSRSLNVRLPEELPERLQQAVRSSRNAAAAMRPSVSSSRVVPPGRDSLLREMRGTQIASAWEEVLSPQQQQRQRERELEEEAAAYEHEEAAGRHTRAFASPSGNPGPRGRAAHADAAARHRSASVGHVLRMRGSPARDGYARHAEEAAEEAPAAGYAYSHVGQQAADLSPHRVRSTSVPSQRRPSDSAGRPTAAGGSRGRHAQPAAGTAARVMAALDGVRTASAVATTASGASAASPLVKALTRLSEEIHAAENRRLGREAPPYATDLQPAAAAALLRAGRTDLVGGSSAPQPSPGTRGNVRMTVTVTSRGQPAAGTPAPGRAAATGSDGPLADLGRPHRRQHSDDLSTQASVHSYDSERDGETDGRAATSGAGAMPTRVPAPVAAPSAPAAPVAAPLVLASNATRATASQVPAPVALAAVQSAAAAAVVSKPGVDGTNQELMVDIAALQAELAMLAQIGQEAEEAEAAVHGKGLSKTFDGPVAATVSQTAPVL